MPANLPPQYHAAEEAYRKASTIEQKIEALQEMITMIPKHKGTEKLQGDLKRRLSKLREEGQKKGKASHYNPFAIEKQGAGQVALIGYPNTGKSSLIAALTRAKAKVAQYPFTTALPLAGMMPYENILIQMIDTPPISSEGAPPGLLNVLREADLLLVTIDASSSECLEQLEGSFSFLLSKKIIKDPSTVISTEADQKEEKRGDEKEPAEKEDGDKKRTFTPYLIALTKMDMEVSHDNLTILRELRPEMHFLTLSPQEETGFAPLKKMIYHKLEIARVYTKAPNKQPDLEAPFVLKKGSTVLDLAYSIHRDFPEKLKNARVWGSAKFDGQTVAREHILEDGDIVELNVEG